MPLSLQYAHMNDADVFQSLYPAVVDFNLAGDNVLVSGVTDKQILVYRVFLVVGGVTNLTFKNGVSTNLTGALPMLANGSIVLDVSNIPWFQASVGKDLILGSSNGVQVSGVIYYQQS